MKKPLYPQEILEDEADLGFRHLLVYGHGLIPNPAAAIVRILSASDILIKFNGLTGGICYSHMRWGYPKNKTMEDLAWWPVSDAFSQNALAGWLQEFDFSEPEFYAKGVKGIAFKYDELP